MAKKQITDLKRSSVLEAFGQAVRECRKAQGFSQESFAHYCGLDRSYMGGVERGERNITLTNIERIISALQMKPSDFFLALDAHFHQIATQWHTAQLTAFSPQKIHRNTR